MTDPDMFPVWLVFVGLFISALVACIVGAAAAVEHVRYLRRKRRRPRFIDFTTRDWLS